MSTAHFVRGHSPITFVDFPYDASASITVHGGSTTKSIDAGHTGSLASREYIAVYPGDLAHFLWFATSNITVVSPTKATTVIEVRGSGALYVVAELGGRAVVAVPAGIRDGAVPISLHHSAAARDLSTSDAAGTLVARTTLP
ncbi:MAG: hypothetical protein ACREDE_01530 [Thermoplasmata archaeon]